MTEFEIIQSYKQAKDKNKQIEIISDMAETTPDEIIKVLQDNGVIVGMPKKKKQTPTFYKCQTKWTDKMLSDLKKLVSEGLGNKEIAERMDIDAHAISNKLWSMRKHGEIAPFETPLADKFYIRKLERQLVEQNAENDNLKHKLEIAQDEITARKRDCAAYCDTISELEDKLNKYIDAADAAHNDKSDLIAQLDDVDLFLRLCIGIIEDGGTVTDALLRAQNNVLNVKTELEGKED